MPAAQDFDPDVIRPYKKPLKERAGFKVLKGNLSDSAIMKISVIADEFRNRYLSNPKDPDVLERWCSMDRRLPPPHDDPASRSRAHRCSSARRPDRVSGLGRGTCSACGADKTGITALPCIGDGASRVRRAALDLNASPEAAAGGGLALLQTGDRVRVDVGCGNADIMVSSAELAGRRRVAKNGGYHYPPSRRLGRISAIVDQPRDGMVPASGEYQRVAQKAGVPRNSH
jgi:dihydroxy-acid dehydratase